MNDQYEKIADALSANLPADFLSVVLRAQVGDDWTDKEIWYQTAEDRLQPEISSSSSFQIGRSLRELRNSMTMPGQEPWSRCTFTLFPDGKFKFDVEYDD